ncbi:hypothetical protein [Streptomyces sp. MC1]|uniref:hypothetical protein n=1 Tax=Streptomyces sp. MC1 TaxID=295105 RepID=UPI0018CA3049|nr:hypothetical protein [Streptomyces sp. MC1]
MTAIGVTAETAGTAGTTPMDRPESEAARNDVPVIRFDVIGGGVQRRSADLVRAGGTLVTVIGPPEARPADGLAVGFVVETDRAWLGAVVQRIRDWRLRTNIGSVSTLEDAVSTRPSGSRARPSSAFARKDADTAETPVTS